MQWGMLAGKFQTIQCENHGSMIAPLWRCVQDGAGAHVGEEVP
jgi:hypothetical protein